MIQGQQIIRYNMGPGLMTLEDTSTTKFFFVDTTVIGNAWQMGQPSKIFFDSAHFSLRALVTDSAGPIAPNTRSTVYMTVLRDQGFIQVFYYQMMDSDTLLEGGTVEVSLDGGLTWGNVLDSAYLMPYGAKPMFTGMFYSQQDTVAALGGPGFSGHSDGWEWKEFGIFYQDAPFTWDTIRLRFVFTSDSISNGREGWMIDDIQVLFNHAGTVEIDPGQALVFPNPFDAHLSVSAGYGQQVVLKVFDISGRCVAMQEFNRTVEVDTHRWPAGVYGYELLREGAVYRRGKLVKY